MESGSSDHLGILALAVVCLLPALGAAWKAASWRGDIFNKWSSRVDFAHAGLNERANAELVALQEALTDALGARGEFDPDSVAADPDPLVEHANRCAKLLKARDKVRGRFRRLRQLGPVLIPTVAAYLLGWGAATLYFTDVVERSWLKLVGFIVGGIAIAVAVAVFCLYAYFEAKL